MPRIYMAVATEDRHPITDIMRQTPDIPENCQWAVFLRNHDELTLEMVTDRERDYLWNHYAADRRARINLGIRRRLAPLMENDRRRIELLNALLLSMPGTPVLYYGDEIGMGDNIFLRRPRRRAHADAVVVRPQWRLLARRSGAALPAADHGPGLRLRGGQCRGAEPLALVAAELDEAADRRAPLAARLRPRHLALSLSGEPQGHRLSARTTATRSSCASSTCRARRRRSSSISSEFRGRYAGRAARPQRLSADRRPPLSADPAGAQLLLVRADARALKSRQPAILAARIRHPGHAAGLGRSVAPAQSAAARKRRDPGLSGAPALVRRQGPAHRQVSVAASARSSRPAGRGGSRRPFSRRGRGRARPRAAAALFRAARGDLVAGRDRVCARAASRSRSPSCASSAAKAPSSTRCRRTALSWR